MSLYLSKRKKLGDGLLTLSSLSSVDSLEESNRSAILDDHLSISEQFLRDRSASASAYAHYDAVPPTIGVIPPSRDPSVAPSYSNFRKRGLSETGMPEEEEQTSKRRRLSDGSEQTAVGQGSPARTDASLADSGTPVDSPRAALSLIQYPSSSSSSPDALSPYSTAPYDLPTQNAPSPFRGSSSPFPQQERGITPGATYIDPSKSPALSEDDSFYASASPSRQGSPLNSHSRGGKTRTGVVADSFEVPPFPDAEYYPDAATSPSSSDDSYSLVLPNVFAPFPLLTTPTLPAVMDHTQHALLSPLRYVKSNIAARKSRKVKAPASVVIPPAPSPFPDTPGASTSQPRPLSAVQARYSAIPLQRSVVRKPQWDPATSSINEWMTSGLKSYQGFRGRKTQLGGTTCKLCTATIPAASANRHFNVHLTHATTGYANLRRAVEDAEKEGGPLPPYYGGAKDIGFRPNDVLYLAHRVIVENEKFNPAVPAADRAAAKSPEDMEPYEAATLQDKHQQLPCCV